MFRSKQSQRASERATEYASCKDFQQIFKEDMAGLHLLAYLLTADQQKAEQCFVAGLEDSIHGNPVFKQWARTWSKRAIIQNAIKVVAPKPAQDSMGPQSSESGLPERAAFARSGMGESGLPERAAFARSGMGESGLPERAAFARSGMGEPGLSDDGALVRSGMKESPLVALVLQWTAFERFVFVMSVLEGYAVRECAALLSCTDQEIIAARSQVLERLADGSWQAAAVLSSPRWNALFARAQVA